jgi:signal transduction histidine kinase
MVGALLLVHGVYFEKFYMAWKTEKLQRELNKFAVTVSSSEISYTEFFKLKQKIMLENNASINIVDEKGDSLEQKLRKNQQWYAVTIEYENKAQRKIVLSEYDILMHLQGRGIEIDDCYYIIGGTIDEQYDYILGMIECEMFDNVDNYIVQEDSNINYNASPIWHQIKVIDISIASQSEIKSYSFSMMDNNTIIIEEAISGGFPILPFSSAGQINMDKTVTNHEGKQLKFYLVASLQPIDEASSAITSYYPWFFLVAVFTALVVAYIYSRYVSKPIIKISKAANEMADGKLDTRIENKQNNEIGTLSNSLNLLSANLQSSMDELKEANEKLIEDIAEKAHQEKVRREFTANVSHDLKTPLGVMRCYVEMLRDDIEPDKKEEYYDIVLSEIGKMNKMVQQMLQLAKAESGDIKLDRSQFSLEEMISDIILMFKPMFEEKNMSINISGDFYAINADELRMEQVLSNLMGNAVKYGLIGTSIEIKGFCKDNKCRVGIINSCNQITQEKANDLFKRFYMLDKSRNVKGTGLGLNICAAIFELHDFEYGVTSHGDSIEFWFEYTAS